MGPCKKRVIMQGLERREARGLPSAPSAGGVIRLEHDGLVEDGPASACWRRTFSSAVPEMSRSGQRPLALSGHTATVANLTFSSMWQDITLAPMAQRKDIFKLTIFAHNLWKTLQSLYSALCGAVNLIFNGGRSRRRIKN